MKKAILLLLTILFVISTMSCTTNDTSEESQIKDEYTSNETNQNNNENDEAMAEIEESSPDLFKALPSDFIFSSGAGGWFTKITLSDDGTFTGQYYDADLGFTGDKYPNGTVYICNFNGKFTTPKEINEYIYSMNLDSLNVEGTPGTEYFENDTKYVVSDPYGFENADEFLIYLPGCPLEDADEDFLSWSFINRQIRQTIPAGVYGIYNVGGMEGFMGEEDNSLWKKTYSYSYNSCRSELRPTYYSESQLVFWQESGPAVLNICFDWFEDNITECLATDSMGSGTYTIEMDLSEDLSSVQITLRSISGFNLEPWGGSADGILKAEYTLKPETSDMPQE
jgi:hypothetical protein